MPTHLAGWCYLSVPPCTSSPEVCIALSFLLAFVIHKIWLHIPESYSLAAASLYLLSNYLSLVSLDFNLLCPHCEHLCVSLSPAACYASATPMWTSPFSPATCSVSLCAFLACELGVFLPPSRSFLWCPTASLDPYGPLWPYNSHLLALSLKPWSFSTPSWLLRYWNLHLGVLACSSLFLKHSSLCWCHKCLPDCWSLLLPWSTRHMGNFVFLSISSSLLHPSVSLY